MMKPVSTLLVLLSVLTLAPSASRAETCTKPDDAVAFQLSAEDWVTTQTARVQVSIEAAVTSKTAGSMRAEMTKAVNDMVKADWRLVSFFRSQDTTGMGRWSAVYEARVPENLLGGLSEDAKSKSKPGMQLTVQNMDFSPTLAEVEAVNARLRTQIYKMANDQLAELNKAMPARSYRIASINFMARGGFGMQPPMMARTMMAKAMGGPEMAEMNAIATDSAPAMEKSEKVEVTATVTLATEPATATVKQ